MVANLEQYIFLHDALLEAVLCGETGVTSNDLGRHYDQLITVNNGSAPIQEEFETLQVLTPRLTTEECQTARLARNRPKNRFMDVLPADRDLPYLITPDPAGSGNGLIFIFLSLVEKLTPFLNMSVVKCSGDNNSN